MITKNVCELSIVVLTQSDVNLIALKCLLEVHRDLSCHLGKLFSRKPGVAALAEEKILGLCETQVGVHQERLLCEIERRLTCRKSRGHGHEFVENPGSLLEMNARLLDAVTRKVHVASLPSETDGVVIHRRVLINQWALRLNLLFVERVLPLELDIQLRLTTSKR